MAPAGRRRASKSASSGDEPDPDRLVRQKAGAYRTADERFEVQQGDTGWFLVDSSQTNDFGQPLMLGPFGTLAEVRGVLPRARAGQPALRPIPDAGKQGAVPARPGSKAAAPPSRPRAPSPPRTWIDDLPASEATRVRALIRQLEREGVANPERVVRADRDGLLPAVATRLIEMRLEALVDELPDAQRRDARRMVRRVAEILSAEGAGRRAPLPGWTLVETRSGEQAGRRIVLRPDKV